MRIKITKLLPTQVSPNIGEEFEVVRVEHNCNGNVYFIDCHGVELGVLWHEMKVIER